MRRRAFLVLRFAGNLALVAAWLLWWLPTLALLAVQLGGEAARFGLVIAASRVLGALGLRVLAIHMCQRERDRCAARMAEMGRRE